MKRILIINQAMNCDCLSMYCRLISDFGNGTIISGFFNESREIENVRLIAAPKHDAQSLFSRFACWYKFLLFVFKFLHREKRKYDLVWVFSNPPIAIFFAWILKVLKGWPFLIQIWDIYPDIIERKMKGAWIKPITWLWGRLNILCFKEANGIITIGPKMKFLLEQKYCRSNDEIKVIPNWANPDVIFPIKKEINGFISRFGLSQKFVVLYSGKMGLSHEIETILEAAYLLKSDEDIVFVFIGHGPGFGIVSSFLKANPETNVKIFARLSDEDFRQAVAMADIGLVSQESGMDNVFFPSKVFNLMSAGVAILGICGYESDLRKLIVEKNLGFAVDCGDFDSLKRLIVELKSNKKLLDEIKMRCRQAIKDEFNPEKIYSQYAALIRNFFDDVKKKF